MPKTLTFQRPNKLNLLHDQLLAAGIVPLVVEGSGEFVTVTVEDSVTEAAVDAVVAVHNPALPSVAEQVDTARAQGRNDLATQYAQARNRLLAIVQDGSAYNGAAVRDAVVDLARFDLVILRLLKDLAAT